LWWTWWVLGVGVCWSLVDGMDLRTVSVELFV
jgi:hypothetical protein